MAGDLSLWNISTSDGDGFYKLTWKSKVMGRFSTWKQANAYKLSIYRRVTSEGKLRCANTCT